jgi:hypothetical protein
MKLLKIMAFKKDKDKLLQTGVRLGKYIGGRYVKCLANEEAITNLDKLFPEISYHVMEKGSASRDG